MPGGATNITCVAVGSPMPFVKWRLGAIELTPEDNIPIGKNVLMLADVMESANYTCVATSDLGNIESVARVKVKGSGRSNDSISSYIYTCYVQPSLSFTRRRTCACPGIDRHPVACLQSC